MTPLPTRVSRVSRLAGFGLSFRPGLRRGQALVLPALEPGEPQLVAEVAGGEEPWRAGGGRKGGGGGGREAICWVDVEEWVPSSP